LYNLVDRRFPVPTGRDCRELQYHLHDKDGRPVKVARRKPVRSKSEAAPVEEKAAIGEKTADRPVEATPAQPVAVAAAAAVETDNASSPWILLMLFLLLLLVVRRNRRKASDAEQTVIR
jgi:hypothetical protein